MHPNSEYESDCGINMPTGLQDQGRRSKQEKTIRMTAFKSQIKRVCSNIMKTVSPVRVPGQEKTNVGCHALYFGGVTSLLPLPRS